MVGKPKKSSYNSTKGGNKGEEEDGSTAHNSTSSNRENKQVLPSTIKNKDKRSAVHAKLKQQKKLDKRKKAKAREASEKRALELGEEVCMFVQFFFYLQLIAS